MGRVYFHTPEIDRWAKKAKEEESFEGQAERIEEHINLDSDSNSVYNNDDAYNEVSDDNTGEIIGALVGGVVVGGLAGAGITYAVMHNNNGSSWGSGNPVGSSGAPGAGPASEKGGVIGGAQVNNGSGVKASSIKSDISSAIKNYEKNGDNKTLEGARDAAKNAWHANDAAITENNNNAKTLTDSAEQGLRDVQRTEADKKSGVTIAEDAAESYENGEYKGANDNLIAAQQGQEALDKRVEDLEGQIDGAEYRKKEAESDETNAKDALDTSDGALPTLKENLDSAEGALTSAENKLQSLKNQKAAAPRNCANGTVSTKSQIQSQIDKLIAQEENNVKELKKKVAGAKKLYEDELDNNKKCQEKYNKAHEAAEKARNDFQAVTTTLDEAKTAQAKGAEAVEYCEGQLEVHRKALDEKKKAVVKANSAYEDARQASSDYNKNTYKPNKDMADKLTKKANDLKKENNTIETSFYKADNALSEINLDEWNTDTMSDEKTVQKRISNQYDRLHGEGAFDSTYSSGKKTTNNGGSTNTQDKSGTTVADKKPSTEKVDDSEYQKKLKEEEAAAAKKKAEEEAAKKKANSNNGATFTPSNNTNPTGNPYDTANTDLSNSFQSTFDGLSSLVGNKTEEESGSNEETEIVEYTTRSGDTMRGIAKSQCGLKESDSKASFTSVYNQIMSLNPDIYKGKNANNADYLPANVTIKIPVKKQK